MEHSEKKKRITVVGVMVCFGVAFILSSIAVAGYGLLAHGRVCTTHTTLVEVPGSNASRPSSLTTRQFTKTADCAPIQITTGYPLLAAVLGAALLLPAFLAQIPEGSSIETALLKLNRERSQREAAGSALQSARATQAVQDIQSIAEEDT